MSKGLPNNGSNSGASGNGKRRQPQRAPQPVSIRLCSDLEPNRQHPLAELQPSICEDERRKLLATILARLAGGTIDAEHDRCTIETYSAPQVPVENEPKPEGFDEVAQ